MACTYFQLSQVNPLKGFALNHLKEDIIIFLNVPTQIHTEMIECPHHISILVYFGKKSIAKLAIYLTLDLFDSLVRMQRFEHDKYEKTIFKSRLEQN